MRLLQRAYSSELLRGSFFVLVAGGVASFGNFLYNLVMGRMLSPSTYGELEAVLSFSVLIAVPMSILSALIIKITSAYWGQNKKGAVRTFLSSYRNKLFFVSLIGSILLLLLGNVLGSLLNLSSILPVVFLSFLFLLTGVNTVNNSGLQGVLAFGFLSANSIAGTAVRLIVSVGLVFLNFKLVGALLGPALGSLTGFLLSALELKHIFRHVAPSEEKIPPTVVKETLVPTLFASLALTVFLTLDVILARHFFSETGSGEFAIVAVLGKVVYYAVVPVISVAFPLISSKAEGKKSYLPSLLGSLGMVFSMGILICLLFFIFPQFILTTLFASKYSAVASYLGPYSFFMVLYSVNSILTYFLLSVSYFSSMWLLFAISLLQGAFIILFHSSIEQLIWVNITVSFLYFVVVSALVIKKEWPAISNLTNSLSLSRPIARQKQSSGMSDK